jgi:hypothetical protein
MAHEGASFMSKQDTNRQRADLAAYIEHATKYGPECIIETAASHLDDRDLGQLKAWFESRQRSYYWQVGRAGGPDSKWVLKREKPKACEYCGKDLPPGMSSRARYHSHCQQAAAKRRQRARRPTPQAPQHALS